MAAMMKLPAYRRQAVEMVFGDDQYNMILAINKPRGMTSHDVVNYVRHVTRERRVGHAGTLDPLARGVLVLVGRDATKRQSEFMRI